MGCMGCARGPAEALSRDRPLPAAQGLFCKSARGADHEHVVARDELAISVLKGSARCTGAAVLSFRRAVR